MTDNRIRVQRNTAQWLGVLISTAVVKAVLQAGLLSAEQTDTITEFLGTELAAGLLIAVGTAVYIGAVKAGKAINVDLGGWLEGYPTAPTYPTKDS